MDIKKAAMAACDGVTDPVALTWFARFMESAKIPSGQFRTVGNLQTGMIRRFLKTLGLGTDDVDERQSSLDSRVVDFRWKESGKWWDVATSIPDGLAENVWTHGVEAFATIPLNPTVPTETEELDTENVWELTGTPKKILAAKAKEFLSIMEMTDGLPRKDIDRENGPGNISEAIVLARGIRAGAVNTEFPPFWFVETTMRVKALNEKYKGNDSLYEKFKMKDFEQPISYHEIHVEGYTESSPFHMCRFVSMNEMIPSPVRLLATPFQQASDRDSIPTLKSYFSQLGGDLPEKPKGKPVMLVVGDTELWCNTKSYKEWSSGPGVWTYVQSLFSEFLGMNVAISAYSCVGLPGYEAACESPATFNPLYGSTKSSPARLIFMLAVSPHKTPSIEWDPSKMKPIDRIMSVSEIPIDDCLMAKTARECAFDENDASLEWEQTVLGNTSEVLNIKPTSEITKANPLIGMLRSSEQVRNAYVTNRTITWNTSSSGHYYKPALALASIVRIVCRTMEKITGFDVRFREGDQCPNARTMVATNAYSAVLEQRKNKSIIPANGKAFSAWRDSLPSLQRAVPPKPGANRRFVVVYETNIGYEKFMQEAAQTKVKEKIADVFASTILYGRSTLDQHGPDAAIAPQEQVCNWFQAIRLPDGCNGNGLSPFGTIMYKSGRKINGIVVDFASDVDGRLHVCISLTDSVAKAAITLWRMMHGISPLSAEDLIAHRFSCVPQGFVRDDAKYTDVSDAVIRRGVAGLVSMTYRTPCWGYSPLCDKSVPYNPSECTRDWFLETPMITMEQAFAAE